MSVTFPTFTMKRTVKEDEIDDLNHVNNVVYNKWANDIAVKHWLTVAGDKLRESVDWVMVKHTLEYKAAAVLGDTIMIKTQVGKATNATYERFIEIYNATTNQLLVRTESVWCAINEHGRPTRISQELKDLFETQS